MIEAAGADVDDARAAVLGLAQPNNLRTRPEIVSGVHRAKKSAFRIAEICYGIAEMSGTLLPNTM